MLHDIHLETERLQLRSPDYEDAPRITALLSDYDVAKSMLNIPHPYPPNGVIDWLDRMKASIAEGAVFYNFAIVLKIENMLIGSIGLKITSRHRRAELGYWLGKTYWGQGYATEAARRVIQFAYQTTDVIRISAGYFVNNPASGRVMQKSGMTYEGTLRQYLERDGVLHDVAYYSILRNEWLAKQHG